MEEDQPDQEEWVIYHDVLFETYRTGYIASERAKTFLLETGYRETTTVNRDLIITRGLDGGQAEDFECAAAHLHITYITEADELRQKYLSELSLLARTVV